MPLPIPASFNGRTVAFGATHWGSIPWAGAIPTSFNGLGRCALDAEIGVRIPESEPCPCRGAWSPRLTVYQQIASSNLVEGATWECGRHRGRSPKPASQGFESPLPCQVFTGGCQVKFGTENFNAGVS